MVDVLRNVAATGARAGTGTGSLAQADARLKEAAKLGFKNAFLPAGTKADVAGLALTEITSVADLLRFAPEPTRRAKVTQ